MFISWTDSADSSSGWVNLLGPGYHVGNGWDQWTIIGPIDLDTLSGLNWGADSLCAQELWLRIHALKNIPGSPIPVDVRIGWVRLEESTP